MFDVVHQGNFGAMSTYDPKEYCYYIEKLNSDTYTLHDDVNIYGKIIKMDKNCPNVRYLSCLIQG